MNRALTEHLQRMLERFATAARREYKNTLARSIFMWQCAKMAFDRAREDEERRFWRGYMKDVERSVDRYVKERKERESR